MAQRSMKSFEEKVTESIPMTGISRKMSRTLTHADEAVTEAVTEMESLTAEVNTLEEQLKNVMEQHAFTLFHSPVHMRWFATRTNQPH